MVKDFLLPEPHEVGNDGNNDNNDDDDDNDDEEDDNNDDEDDNNEDEDEVHRGSPRSFLHNRRRDNNQRFKNFFTFWVYVFYEPDGIGNMTKMMIMIILLLLIMMVIMIMLIFLQ